MKKQRKHECDYVCAFCKNPKWKCVFTTPGSFWDLLRIKCPNLPLIISIIALVSVAAKTVLAYMLQ